MYGKNYRDIESGLGDRLYPGQSEDSELRWGFIRKVYYIIAIQLLATIGVGAFVVSHKSVSHFFAETTGGFVCYFFLIIAPIILLWPLYCYHQSHPLNFFLLALFTITLAFSVGLSCAYTNGKTILEAAILTASVVVGLTLYTFWAAKRGQDFSFLGPFLFSSLIVLLVFGFIQIFFPLGGIGEMIYGCVGAVIFSGYIVYDTDNLIKRYSYDQYILAAIALYLDIINLFLSLLSVLRGADS